MKKTITRFIVSLSLVAISVPSVVFAQVFNNSYTYPSYTTPVYDNNYTYPTYTTPVYDNNYTYPSYTTPTYTNYTTPVYDNNYTYPAYTNYTTPVYDNNYTYPSYTTPTYTNYTTPTVSNYTTAPTYGSTYAPAYSYPSYNYGTPVVPLGTYGNNFSISYVQQNQTCWNGTVVPIGTACPAQTQTCWNGTVVAVGVACPAQTQTCPNGTVVAIGSVCPATTQTCWNGSVIPTTQACPSQFQTCWNGSVIPVTQVCPANYTPVVYNQPTYYTPQPTYTTQPTLTVNNVVTGLPTQISDTSAKCNGIGLIADNLSTTGWFEYGDTPSLGRTTQSANIGTYHTTPFSNVLANLKPNTTYYCRAGMSNSYGTMRGEIVKFTTKSKAVAYVKPTPTITYPSKTVAKKPTNICTNDATTLAEGQKAVTLLLEKTKGDTTINGEVTYSLSYNNISSSNLKDVVAKIVLPQELSFVSSAGGNYDEATRNLTITIGSLGSLSQGSVSITAKVSDKAQIGKTVITTGYIVYTVSDSSKLVGMQDEVTTYILGTIMPSVDQTNLGAKNVAGEGMLFLPNTFVEWLALLAIIFILIVLGRSIYTSYKEDENKHH